MDYVERVAALETHWLYTREATAEHEAMRALIRGCREDASGALSARCQVLVMDRVPTAREAEAIGAVSRNQQEVRPRIGRSGQ
jgi:hypothetical protein